MRLPCVPGLLFLGCLLASTELSAAQTVGVTTGAVNGWVTDDGDAVLPGVTITVSGLAQMRAQTTVTDERGAYRFPGLPPGEYKLLYELAGFQSTVREQVHVSVGFTATVIVKLAIASLEEVVTVLGASPVVDAAASRIQTNYTAERLASIPNARDIWAIMAASPGVRQAVVDVGGASAGSARGCRT